MNRQTEPRRLCAAWLEAEARRELQLARTVAGVTTQASGCDADFAGGCTWIGKTLVIENVEGIYVDAHVHRFPDGKNLEQRSIRAPVHWPIQNCVTERVRNVDRAPARAVVVVAGDDAIRDDGAILLRCASGTSNSGNAAHGDVVIAVVRVDAGCCARRVERRLIGLPTRGKTAHHLRPGLGRAAVAGICRGSNITVEPLE